MATIILTVIGEDRPGLVSALSAPINAHGASWKRSQMSRLAGKFAGIVLVSVADDRQAEYAVPYLHDGRGQLADGSPLLFDRGELLLQITLVGTAALFLCAQRLDHLVDARKEAGERPIVAAEIEGLQREADVMCALGPEHTPLVHETGRTRDGRLYIAMERLAGAVSEEDMRAMNFAVDVEKRDVAATVRDFLDRLGVYGPEPIEE